MRTWRIWVRMLALPFVAGLVAASFSGCARARQPAAGGPTGGPGGAGGTESRQGGGMGGPGGAGAGARESRQGGGEGDRAQMRAQMVDRMIQSAELNDEQAGAVRAALKAKDEARQALTEELTSLQRTANKSGPTEQELQQALEAYRGALARYQEKLQAADAALAKQLPLSAQVRCTSLGIMENGLGMMGMRGGAVGGRGGGPGASQRPEQGARRGAE